jgi:hypothetical protein
MEELEVTPGMVKRAIEAYKEEVSYRLPEDLNDPEILEVMFENILWRALNGDI